MLGTQIILELNPIILLCLHISAAEIYSHAFKWNVRDGVMTIALVASDVCLQGPFGVLQSTPEVQRGDSLIYRRQYVQSMLGISEISWGSPR